jgi:hypothetical protein
MELHTGSGLLRLAMMGTSWIWSEVDAIIADAVLFSDLAVASILGDDGGLGSNLGLVGLDLGLGVFLLLKIDFWCWLT